MTENFFKIQFNNQCKMIKFPNSLEELIKIGNSIFNIEKEQKVIYSYLNEQNNKILLLIDEDYNKLLEKSKLNKKTIKINVELFNEKQSDIHLNIKCDECGICPIKGIRYKCNNCHEFNLCEKCENEKGNKHDHPFIKLNNPNSIKMLYNNLKNTSDKSENDNNLINDEKKGNSPSNNFLDNIINVCGNFCNYFIPEHLKYSSTCQNENLTLNIEDKKEIKIKLSLLNDGSIEWPSPSYFTCLKGSSDIIGKDIKLNDNIQPNNSIEIEINLDLSNLKKSGKYISVWQFKTIENIPFGEFVTITINYTTNMNYEVKNNNYNNINRFNNNMNEIALKQIINELRNKYDLSKYEDDNPILTALIDSNGNKEEAMKLLNI